MAENIETESDGLAMHYWTVKIGVAECWIEDGFDFTKHYCENVGQELLPYASGDEVSCEVVSAPDPKIIRKLQGYETNRGIPLPNDP